MCPCAAKDLTDHRTAPVQGHLLTAFVSVCVCAMLNWTEGSMRPPGDTRPELNSRNENVPETLGNLKGLNIA